MPTNIVRSPSYDCDYNKNCLIPALPVNLQQVGSCNLDRLLDTNKNLFEQHNI